MTLRRRTTTRTTSGAARLRRWVGLLGLLLLLPQGIEAQIRPVSAGGNTILNTRTRTVANGQSATGQGTAGAMADSTMGAQDTNAVKGLQYHTDIPDSVLRENVFIFFHRPMDVKIYEVRNPTLDPTGIEHNDPLDALCGDYYLGKGTIGHPHTSLFPTPAASPDIELQPDPNVGYAKRPGNIRFYQTMTPYTVLSYNSSLDKDYLVQVAHTQNIKPGWNVSMDYRLIRPEGVYTSSGAKNHYLDATSNYFSRDARLQARGGIIWQSFNIDENGGISDDSYFTSGTTSNRSGVPVKLYGMGTTNRELTAFGQASYNLVRQFEAERRRDSIVLRTEGDSLIADTIEIVDTLRVRRPGIVNAGIIGIDAQYDRRKRVFADSTWWREKSATVFWTNDAYPDHRWRNPLKVTVGVTARSVAAAIEGDTLLLRSSADPYARAVIGLGPAELRLDGDLRGSFNDDGKPDARYATTVAVAFDSSRRTHAELMVVGQSKMPDVRMIHDALVHQGATLKQIKTTEYSLHLNHAEIVSLDLMATSMSHNTWYDDALHVVEGEGRMSLYQARLTTRLRLGPMHLDMQNMLQHSTDSMQMPVPTWACKGSLYANLILFRRALRAQIGVDVHYHTAYNAPAYDPYTGLFHHQDEVKVGNYIWADVFLNLNVRRASFYAKAGHVNALWEQSPNYFILPHYPGRRFGFYWGITWHFFD